jgi:hypothetical protein
VSSTETFWAVGFSRPRLFGKGFVALTSSLICWVGSSRSGNDAIHGVVLGVVVGLAYMKIERLEFSSKSMISPLIEVAVVPFSVIIEEDLARDPGRSMPTRLREELR